MELLLIMTTLIAGLAAFAATAVRWGVDSRDCISDDHRR
jgi:hypothetical protein